MSQQAAIEKAAKEKAATRAIAEALSGVMVNATLNAKAKFHLWNQYIIGEDNADYDSWLGKGNCHGLSAQFLRFEKNKENFEAAVTLKSLAFKDQYTHSALAKEITRASEIGNMKGSSAARQHAYMRENQLEYVESAEFGSTFAGFSHTRFARFVGHSNFFYMVWVPGHSMACAAVKGRKVFFDPNAGIAVCSNMEQLTSFCTAYFSDPLVKKNYGKGSKVQLSAMRYRPI